MVPQASVRSRVNTVSHCPRTVQGLPGLSSKGPGALALGSFRTPLLHRFEQVQYESSNQGAVLLHDSHHLQQVPTDLVLVLIGRGVPAFSIRASAYFLSISRGFSGWSGMRWNSGVIVLPGPRVTRGIESGNDFRSYLLDYRPFDQAGEFHEA